MKRYAWIFVISFCFAATATDIPFLMYHHVTDKIKGRYYVTPAEFRSHLEKLYNAGFVTAPLRDILAKKRYLKNKKVVVLRFDGARFNQFNYIKDADGKLKINPQSAVGILLDFYKEHPKFGKNALFVILPQGFEQPEYMKKKLEFLLDNGMELCNHGNKHIDLTKGSVADVDKEFGMAIDHWYKILGPRASEINTLATPFGAVPKNKEARERLKKFQYDGKTYPQKAVLFAGWGYNRVTPSPFSRDFDPHALPSIEVNAKDFDTLLASLTSSKKKP
jgi:peptidoglycan/xylan/chitin deacetylase (PgdA/CDA1 family)